MKSLKESILSSTKSGRFQTPVKWSKEFESLKEAEKAFLDFYNIKDKEVKEYINHIFDIYNREYGWPSSFIFDLDFEEKAKHQGIKSFNPKNYKSKFTGNSYIIAYNDGEYYIWDDTNEYFNYVFSVELLNFIEKR
jgi:hypothetical protein